MRNTKFIRKISNYGATFSTINKRKNVEQSNLKRVGIYAVGGPGPQIRNLCLLTISDLWSIGMVILS